MLGHQLPALPPLAPFLEELPVSVRLARRRGRQEAAAGVIAYARDEDQSWSPPPSVATWRAGVPLETVRFSAANHLLIELDYDGRTRLIEPYSLRRTRAGNLILHAERADGSGHRSYRVEKIQGLRTTTTPFRPRFPIEFSARGPLHAPPAAKLRSLPRARVRVLRGARPGKRNECIRCGRHFPHARRNSALRKHKDEQGYPCPGRRGRYVGERFST